MCPYAVGPLHFAVLYIPETLEIADKRRRVIAALNLIENIVDNFHYE
jgi:hypothetical protein